MTREEASKYCHEQLSAHGLKGWGVRLNTDSNSRFLGMCSYKDKCIILSAHHIDIHPSPDVKDTILHEIAHALTPGELHNEVWAAKAKSIGCTQLSACSNLTLTPAIIEAIRSGATVEITYEEEVIRRPKYQITRLQDRCDYCGKVAKEVSNTLIKSNNEDTPDERFIVLECGHLFVKKIPKGTPFHKLIWNSSDPNCTHDWNGTTKCIDCGAFKPYKFQEDGMNFAEQALAVNKGVAILDEMGLGKTIQALGYAKFHPEVWPILYVLKSGTRFQWLSQILNICGDEFMGQVISGSNDFLIPNLRTYIVSYDLLVPKVKKLKSGKIVTQGLDINKFKKLGIKMIVLDECQQIKNPDSSRTQQVRRLVNDKFWRQDEHGVDIPGRETHTVKVIALSGTPWKNRGSEFYSVLNMIAPSKFAFYQQYLDKWVQYFWDGNKKKEGGIKNPELFKEYIKDIAIRRERIEVMPELPQVNRTKLLVQMTEDEDKIYNEEEEKFVQWYQEMIIGGEETNSINILAKLSRMRHLVGLAKIPTTVTQVEEFLEDTDRKLVIFTHHKDVGLILKEELTALIKKNEEDWGNIPVYMFTGDTPMEEKFKIQNLFNTQKRSIIVASTLAAGESFNLQTCSDCIMHERQWNPANEEQAEGRFIRIGQASDRVDAIYTEAVGSVDAFFDGIVENKRRYFYKSMNKNEAPPWNQNDIIKELAEIIVKQHNRKKAA